MKARVLKKLLNNTKYNISNNESYIAVGSPYCHDLIKVDKETLKISYALDTWKEGRKCLDLKEELAFIWDKLQELIDSGEIQDIINGQDVIENPLPVFTFKDGQIIETITDEYGWPNTDIDGNCMYNNTYFKTKKEAIEQGIREYTAGVSITKMSLEEAEERYLRVKDSLEKYTNYLENFEKLKDEKNI